jgi:hypothetical protein
MDVSPNEVPAFMRTQLMQSGDVKIVPFSPTATAWVPAQAAPYKKLESRLFTVTQPFGSGVRVLNFQISPAVPAPCGSFAKTRQ